MEEREIWDRLGESFRDVFEDDEIEIGPETTASDIEDWDSLTHIQLVVAIESAFGVRFNTGEVAGLANVGEMVELIRRKTG
ncbi:MAG: acyl carrier protein [Vicinamibacteria bacterium]